METFWVRLEALDPMRKRFRAYRIDAGIDLFGTWLVEVTFGRIGTGGRTVRYSTENANDARKIVRRCLQRRSTAPTRIGVNYIVCEFSDPWEWLGLTLIDSDRSHSSKSNKV